MPSSTPNYNWPYPISTDDLNAGATEIGNLATAADATMATKAPLVSPALSGNPTAPTQATSDNSTRLATTAYVKNNLASYATSNKAYLNVQYASVATSGGGGFNLGAGTRKFVLGAWIVSSGTPLIVAHTGSSASDYQVYYWLTNQLIIAGSVVIALYYLDMPL